MERSSLLDLGIAGRTLFAGVYLAVQAALVATAGERPDGLFAFQMFNESSTISIRLSRRVRQGERTAVVPVADGKWEARDAGGIIHVLRWTDRVADPILGTLGRPVQAAYGVGAQLFRLEKALDDVAGHLDGDAETRALLADVEVRQNGRPPVLRHLESAR